MTDAKKIAPTCAREDTVKNEEQRPAHSATACPTVARRETVELAVGGIMLTATIGFDTIGQPVEVFLSGAKDGSGLAAILDDASVVIGIALQHGIPAQALAKSIARLPMAPLVPPYLDQIPRLRAAASAIGTALDLITAYESSPHL